MLNLLFLQSLLISTIAISLYVPTELWILSIVFFLCATLNLMCVVLDCETTGKKFSVYWFWVALFTLAGYYASLLCLFSL